MPIAADPWAALPDGGCHRIAEIYKWVDVQGNVFSRSPAAS
jgi:hypothetical protein